MQPVNGPSQLRHHAYQSWPMDPIHSEINQPTPPKRICLKVRPSVTANSALTFIVMNYWHHYKSLVLRTTHSLLSVTYLPAVWCIVWWTAHWTRRQQDCRVAATCTTAHRVHAFVLMLTILTFHNALHITIVLILISVTTMALFSPRHWRLPWLWVFLYLQWWLHSISLVEQISQINVPLMLFLLIVNVKL